MALEPWTVERWGELETLRQLLNDCERIDNGSGIIARLQRISETARKLSKANYGSHPFRESLMSFLEGRAIAALGTQNDTPRKDGDE
jgi:hypothetical protein